MNPKLRSIMAINHEENPKRVTYEFSRNNGHAHYTCTVHLPHLKTVIIAFLFVGKTQKTIFKICSSILGSKRSTAVISFTG